MFHIHLLFVATIAERMCIPLGSLNRVPALAGIKAGISHLPGGK